MLRCGDGALMQVRKAGIACEPVYDAYVTDARHAGQKRCPIELTPIYPILQQQSCSFRRGTRTWRVYRTQEFN